MKHQTRAAALALFAVVGLGAGCADESSEPVPGDASSPLEVCNGHAELCDRRFDEVAFAASHNSMSNAADGWLLPNQNVPIETQLDDGVRAMLIDIYDEDGELALCHGACGDLLGERPLDEALEGLLAFMNANPNEVISLLIEPHAGAEQIITALSDVGLADYAYAHTEGDAWPTLGEMIASGQRLVVTTEGGVGSAPWYHSLWAVASDNPYTYATKEDFSCAHNRGHADNDLYLVNHWLGPPSAEKAEVVNSYAVLSAHMEACQTSAGRIPNFVAVDFSDVGDLLQVVDELNGVGSAPSLGEL